eukprot:jgi/Bigna1/129652/aug1.9_g4360
MAAGLRSGLQRCFARAKISPLCKTLFQKPSSYKVQTFQLIGQWRENSTATESMYEGTSPYIRRSLARDWTREELEDIVAEGYRHPEVDVEQHLLERKVEEAMEIFEGFKPFADPKTWGQVIWAHGRTGNLDEMARLYLEMTRVHNIRPTEPIFSLMLKCMNRFEAYEAAFTFYEEEMKPRKYVRLTFVPYLHLFKACENAKKPDVMESMWDDYFNYYERKSRDELWNCRLLVTCASSDWPLLQSICNEMDEKSLRVRAQAFRAIMALIPETGLTQSIERLANKLRRTDPQYSVKPRKERTQKIHFQSQVELFDLVRMVANFYEKESQQAK